MPGSSRAQLSSSPITVSSDEYGGGKVEYVYEMFPSIDKKRVNKLISLCRGRIDDACRLILDRGLTTKSILNLYKARKFFTSVRRVTIDYNHMLADALAIYKNPSFDPRVPFEVTFEGMVV